MKLLKEKLIEKIAEHIATVILTIISTVILVAAQFVPVKFINSVDPLAWFWLVVVLIIACIALAVYIFVKRPKYVFIPDVAIYKEKRTGNYFCPSCMANGKKSHLKEYDNGWVCMTKDCNRKYYKPGKEPDPPKRKVINKGWVNGWR